MLTTAGKLYALSDAQFGAAGAGIFRNLLGGGGDGFAGDAAESLDKATCADREVPGTDTAVLPCRDGGFYQLVL